MELIMMGISFPHPKGAFCPRQARTDYTVCCFETPFLYEAEGVLHSGNAGDLLIIPPGQVRYHGPRREAQTGFVNDWLHIAGADFARLLQRYPLPVNRAFSVGRGYFLRNYMQRIQAEFHSTDPGRADMLCCLITEMTVGIYRAWRSANTVRTPEDALTQIRRTVAANPAENWTLDRLAALSGYSVSRFSELYRQNFGVSPIRDLLNQRLELAKRLLASGQASVSFTARHCGFRSASYFSRFFTESTGCSPTEFIRQHAERIMPERQKDDGSATVRD